MVAVICLFFLYVFCLCIRLSEGFSVCIFVCVRVILSVYLSLIEFFCLWVCLVAHFTVCDFFHCLSLSVCICLCLFLNMDVCLYVCVVVFVCLCVSVSLSMSPKLLLSHKQTPKTRASLFPSQNQSSKNIYQSKLSYLNDYLDLIVIILNRKTISYFFSPIPVVH